MQDNRTSGTSKLALLRQKREIQTTSEADIERAIDGFASSIDSKKLMEEIARNSAIVNFIIDCSGSMDGTSEGISEEIFAEEFKLKRRIRRRTWSRGGGSYYFIESENVFLSSNSHAIEIIDEENEQIAVVILNLLDEGELFADIMRWNVENIDVLEAIRRALIDQKNCNSLITGISIGMDEDPWTDRFNRWRDVVAWSHSEWTKEIKWIKFEYLFKTQMYGDSYKGYRARFMLEGKEQKLNPPNPHVNPYIEWRRHRRDYW